MKNVISGFTNLLWFPFRVEHVRTWVKVAWIFSLVLLAAVVIFMAVSFSYADTIPTDASMRSHEQNIMLNFIEVAPLFLMAVVIMFMGLQMVAMGHNLKYEEKHKVKV